MRSVCVWLFPLALWAGQARYARMGDFDGTVEIQLHAADAWETAQRNMPVGELAWLRTSPGSRAEIEFDEGSVLRLAGESQVELSDYTRLSTGQRITLISLDHGVAYCSGAAEGKDVLIVAVPGAQITIGKAAHLRLEAGDPWIQIAAEEGAVRFSSPSAEFDLLDGQMVRMDPSHPARFFLLREIPPLESDRWNEERSKTIAAGGSTGHVGGLRYGVADLDSNGVWLQSADFGTVWKPKVAETWAPYRKGKWRWYEGLGYTWISQDSWGWLPYHYGRWMQLPDTGWVWVPGKANQFKPGDVYWLRYPKVAGWGPLAPGEDWKPPDVPRLYLNANTTYAAYPPEAREVDPQGFSYRPEEPLATARFALALPSPTFLASSLEVTRPVLRAGSTRIVPYLRGVTFEGPPELAQESVGRQQPQAKPAESVQSAIRQQVQQPVVIVNNPPQEAPEEIYYPVPVYTGIIVVNPPERTKKAAQARTSRGRGDAVTPPSASTPNAPRGNESPHRPSAPPGPPAPEPDKPVR